MTSKQVLLASAAVAGLSLVNAAAASASEWYVSVAGGANWADDSSFFSTLQREENVTGPSAAAIITDTFFFDNDPSVGFAVTGAVGMHLDKYMKGLRGEVEVGYRENNVRGLWSSSTNGNYSTTGTADYQHSTFSLMANAWYDFELGGLKPYVGGGIGWARGEVDGKFTHGKNSHDPLSGEESGFAYQLGAGLTFDIQPGLSANLGYRYLKSPDITIAAPHPLDNSLTGDLDNQNHTVTAGLTFGM